MPDLISTNVDKLTMEEFIAKTQRLVHLDLKSCPLKISYLHQLFEVFSNWGVTGLLIEWEDTFPYEDHLVDIGSNYSQLPYSPSEIEEILALAKQNTLSVIPLVQTFGHLEYVLKTSKWRYLREVAKFSSSLCPSHPDSFQLLTSMITQIMKYHSDSKFVHIGGDEVWHLGVCDKCKLENKQYVFLKHVVRVLKFVRQNYPQVTLIMWDDMLRGIDESILIEFNIQELVEPMIWEYHPAETFSLNTVLWEKYERVFANIWIASAFKGATGSCQVLPVIGYHLSNHEKWWKVVIENQHRFKCIRGIAITGWSRYDHYAVLCELMPTGLISLAVCLKMWLSGKYDTSVHTQISNRLGFNEEAPLIIFPLNRPVRLPIPKNLNFPGHQIYTGIEWFANARARFNLVAYSNQVITWLNPWHAKRYYTSAMQVEHILANFNEFLNELRAIEKHLCDHLPEVFYNHTIEEWLGCYLYPLIDKMVELVNEAESQLKGETLSN